MKYFLVSALVLFNSCASVKYDVSRSPQDFSAVRKDVKYVIWTNDGLRQRMKITAVENDSVKGFHGNQNFGLAKNNISKIRKNNTGGTVVLSYLGASIALFAAFVIMWTTAPRTVE